ncbi:hypothetical protein CA13_64220 [Planctomycetes bacterium CA13]|uniref:Uncharacterized protein n=1 Tax=Novipirellula herctigrandis TaxID=2527986 RepID=A0A5C5ZDM8_9BACT|nr:hypothetical protein CA13_64220 [Planctomycetes bacterium CA13]
MSRPQCASHEWHLRVFRTTPTQDSKLRPDGGNLLKQSQVLAAVVCLGNATCPNHWRSQVFDRERSTIHPQPLRYAVVFVTAGASSSAARVRPNLASVNSTSAVIDRAESIASMHARKLKRDAVASPERGDRIGTLLNGSQSRRYGTRWSKTPRPSHSFEPARRDERTA